MSMKRPWYKRYPDHFLAGTMHMTFEQKAAYSIIIDLIHASDGWLKDDDTRIARVMGVRIDYWKRLKKELESLGKLRVNSRESPPIIEFPGTSSGLPPDFSGLSPSQPIEKVRSTANKRIRREEKIEREKRDLKVSSLSQSAGARAGEMEAPLRAAPSEQKPEDKTPALSEEERAVFVRKILGREVRPGRVERPEVQHLLGDED
jgi:hypothetical protein